MIDFNFHPKILNNYFCGLIWVAVREALLNVRWPLQNCDVGFFFKSKRNKIRNNIQQKNSCRTPCKHLSFHCQLILYWRRYVIVVVVVIYVVLLSFPLLHVYCIVSSSSLFSSCLVISVLE